MLEIMQERKTWVSMSGNQDKETMFSNFIGNVLENHKDTWLGFCDACGLTDELQDKDIDYIYREYSFKDPSKKNKDGKPVDQYIDILIETYEDVIIIENKIYSGIGQNGQQLEHYKNWVDNCSDFGDKKRHYVILYPESNAKITDTGVYKRITYAQLLEVFESTSAIKDNRVEEFVYSAKKYILENINIITEEALIQSLKFGVGENTFGVNDKLNIEKIKNGLILSFIGTSKEDLSIKIEYYTDYDNRRTTTLNRADYFKTSLQVKNNRDISSDKSSKNVYGGQYIEIDDDDPESTIKKLLGQVNFLMDTYGYKYKKMYCNYEDGFLLTFKDEESKTKILKAIDNIGGVHFAVHSSNTEATGTSEALRKNISEIYPGSWAYYCFHVDGDIEVSMRKNCFGSSIKCIDVDEYVKSQNDGEIKISTLKDAIKIMNKVINKFDNEVKNNLDNLRWKQSGDDSDITFTLDEYFNENMLVQDLYEQLETEFGSDLELKPQTPTISTCYVAVFHKDYLKKYHYEIVGLDESGKGIAINKATYLLPTIHETAGKGKAEKDALGFSDTINYSKGKNKCYVEHSIIVDKNNLQKTIDEVMNRLKNIYSEHEDQFSKKYNVIHNANDSMGYYINKFIKYDFGKLHGLIKYTGDKNGSKYYTARYSKFISTNVGYHYEVCGINKKGKVVSVNDADYLYLTIHEKENDIINNISNYNNTKISSENVPINQLVKIDPNNHEESAREAINKLNDLFDEYDTGLREKYGIE